jgi:hypothetical protein
MDLNVPVGKYFNLNIGKNIYLNIYFNIYSTIFIFSGLNQAPYYAPDQSYFIFGMSGELTDRDVCLLNFLRIY